MDGGDGLASVKSIIKNWQSEIKIITLQRIYI